MSKGLGQKISIKFTEPIVGDVKGNESAFTIIGQEEKYINGSLINKTYEVESVINYPPKILHEEDFTTGTTSSLTIIDGTIELETNGTTSNQYTSDLTQGKSYLASSILSADYSADKAFDNNDDTLWHSTNSDINWIRVDFEQQIAITKIVYRPESLFQESPKLQGSNDLSIWDNIFTLSGLKANTTSTFTFVNTSTYRYYRLIGNKVGYFNARTIQMMALIPPERKTHGEYTSNAIILGSINVKVFWTETKPNDTNILLEYATGEIINQWFELINGDTIFVNNNLWLKATLETTDTLATPILQDLWLEDTAIPPQDTIMLIMNDITGRIHNTVGEVIVEYDASVGSLMGHAGAVESFIETFTPTDLNPVPNPHDAEHIEVVPTVTIEFVKVTYNNAYADEHIEITPTANINFEYVGIINP